MTDMPKRPVYHWMPSKLQSGRYKGWPIQKIMEEDMEYVNQLIKESVYLPTNEAIEWMKKLGRGQVGKIWEMFPVGRSRLLHH